jgi:hypothetical protein
MTTIQSRSSTRDKLSKLTASSRETYDELINKLIALVPEGDEEGSYSQASVWGFSKPDWISGQGASSPMTN